MFDAGEQTGHAGEAAVPVSPAPSNVVCVGDHTVTLYPRVTMALGIAAGTVTKVISAEAARRGAQGLTSSVETALTAAMEAGLAQVYLRHGIASWTFRDAQGSIEPVTPENIERLLPFDEGGLEVAEAADALYSEAVFAPLAKRLNRLSPSGPVADTTSPTSADGPTPPAPSAPSSPNTSEDGMPFEDPGL